MEPRSLFKTRVVRFAAVTCIRCLVMLLFYVPCHLHAGVKVHLEQTINSDSSYIQLVHLMHDRPNSAIDIYMNGVLAFENIWYQEAIPMTKIDADDSLFLEFRWADADVSSPPIGTQIISLEKNKHYFVALKNKAIPNTLILEPIVNVQNQMENMDTTFSEVTFIQAAFTTDSLNVLIRDGEMIVSNLAYRNSSNLIKMRPEEYYLDIKSSKDLTNLIGTYRLSIQSYKGRRFNVVLDSKEDNKLHLIAIMDSGLTFLVDFSPVCLVQYINVLPFTVDIFKNGSKFAENAETLQAMAYKHIPADIPMNIAIAPFENIGVNNPVNSYVITQYRFENMQKYTAVSGGSVGDVLYPIKMMLFEGARDFALEKEKVEVRIINAIPSEDRIHISNGNQNWCNDLAYGQASPFIEVDPASYNVDFMVASEALSICNIDLTSYQGESLTILATINPSKLIELWLIDHEGKRLKICERVSAYEPYEVSQEVTVFPNPCTDFFTLHGLKEGSDVYSVKIFNHMGKLVYEQNDFTSSPSGISISVSPYSPGLYQCVVQFKNQMWSTIPFVVK